MLIRMAALTAALLVSTATYAAEAALTDPVAGHPDKTYADLVGQVVEGFTLAADGTATADVKTPFRHVDEDSEPADPAGPVTIDGVQVETFRSGGREMLAVRTNLQAPDVWDIVALAVFDPDLKLVDKAEIDLDSSVSIDAPMPISAGDDGLVVRSSHHNAGENYESAQLVYLNGAELTALASIPAYSWQSCEADNVATAAFEVWDDTQPGFWPINASLSIEHAPRTDCPAGDDTDAEAAVPAEPDPAWTKSAMSTYAWSASLGGYVQNSDSITALADEVYSEEGDETEDGEGGE
jgi:hypothetical protein